MLVHISERFSHEKKRWRIPINILHHHHNSIAISLLIHINIFSPEYKQHFFWHSINSPQSTSHFNHHINKKKPIPTSRIL
jgi:hypothetical protein